LEEAMEMVKRGTTTIIKISRLWNITLSSLVYHPNG
jgi:hypothetical protein